jgi:hypothetical protein
VVEEQEDASTGTRDRAWSRAKEIPAAKGMKSVDATVLLDGMLVPQAGAATASRASTTRISRGPSRRLKVP